jgi:hypothetical protein
MKRYLALIGAAVLAVSTATSTVFAQDGGAVNADGTYVVADDDGENVVSGRGDDIAVGEINSGGGGGEILGDPNYLPDTSGAIPTVPGAGDGIIAGIPVALLLLPEVTTTTTPATSAGIATGTVPAAAPAPIETAPAEPVPLTTESTAPTGGFCAQYPTWYDAQLAYENLGGTAADPALVQEVDPNYDGVACEEYMA